MKLYSFESLGEFTGIVRWHERLNELPAWREPFPKAAAAA